MTGLANEAGGHRLQRIPPTERKGRVHSSTVTVAVLDGSIKVDARSLQRADSDFHIEWYSGTGAGGQHRNKHQNSCRMTHLPTGIVQTAQCRSRQNSENEARLALIEQLNNLGRLQYSKDIAVNRKEQVGSGMRGDKIRTYRFQDNTAKDHVTGKSAQCTKVLQGFFELLW